MSIARRPGLVLAALLALLLAAGGAFAACGDDEEDGAGSEPAAVEEEPPPPAEEEPEEPGGEEDPEEPAGEGDGRSGAPASNERRWRTRADEICAEGEREAVSLPLPEGPGDAAADAFARAEILREVRSGIEGLGSPAGLEEPIAAYLAALEADIGTLESGGQLDESAGQYAGAQLDLAQCAALANAIARTP